MICNRLNRRCPPRSGPSSRALAKTANPHFCTVLFFAGAGGSLRAGVTENPVLLTRAIWAMHWSTTAAEPPAYVWPVGITVMVDVMRMPDKAPSPHPLSLRLLNYMKLDDYCTLGGHMEYVRTLEDALQARRLAQRRCAAVPGMGSIASHQPLASSAPAPAGLQQTVHRPPHATLMKAAGIRYGPIDTAIGAKGRPDAVAAAHACAWARFASILDELVGELGQLLNQSAAHAPFAAWWPTACGAPASL